MVSSRLNGLPRGLPRGFVVGWSCLIGCDQVKYREYCSTDSTDCTAGWNTNAVGVCLCGLMFTALL